MGLALAQHLGQVALGVHIQQQDFLSLQRKAGSQVVDGGAFADAALLVCYAGLPLVSPFWEFPPFIDLAACGETGRLCKCMKKAAFSIRKRRAYPVGRYVIREQFKERR